MTLYRTWMFLFVLQTCGYMYNGFVLTNTDWLEEAFQGLAKSVDFFEKNTANIILDGVFGLRVAEGQVEAAIFHIRRHKVRHSVRKFLPRLTSLKRHIHQVARKCMPGLEKLNAEYFWWFYNAIDKPYKVPYIPRHVTPSALLGNETSDYTEAEGDQCFGEIMGIHTSVNKESNRCLISEHCLQMMTQKWRMNYAITHQLLYFIEAQRSGCTEAMEAVLGSGSVNAFQNTFCNQIYTEAQHNALYNLERFYSQDLFFEQCMLCGMIGFEDFLSRDWLYLLLSWQDTSGCFTNDEFDQYRATHKSPTSRRLLYERKLQDGCLSHKTGLGTGLLGLYIRYLVEHEGTFPQKSSTDQRLTPDSGDI